MSTDINNNTVKIFDTTLRDGEQAPGASLNELEKIKIAHALAKLNVDIIEAGFPISSTGDFNAVRRIAAEVQGPTICALARAVEKDITIAAQSLEPAKNKRIHTFIGTSDIHLEHKLNLTKEQCIKKAVSMVELAKSLVTDIEFSPEDAGRSDKNFLYEIIEAVINAGATTINIPDTVGYTVPSEFGQLIYDIKHNVPNIDQAIISVHCHNDLGLAVSNSLAGVINGARQVECTINGIGERAGNTALEEITMILKTRNKLLGLDTNINTQEISRASQLVSTFTSFPVQKNKAIVGANAFAHESGIHQDGMLKNRNTYEIMNPQDIGIQATELPLGARSGKHALKDRLEKLGYELDSEALEPVFTKFKELADKKKQIDDRDLICLLGEEHRSQISQNYYSLENLQVICGGGLPTASIKIKDHQNNELLTSSEIGAGPIDALIKAIRKVIPVKTTLLEYIVHSVTEGINAQGRVTVRLQHNSKIFSGQGADPDIVTASAKAYLHAINKLSDSLENN